jgi:iron complex transport system permease protein
MLRLGILFGASLLTAAAVTLSGSIGFVGLVVPHMMRLVVGADHRRLVPASALAGSCLLVLTEMIARTVLAPQQLPVGVITAFVGVPVFLYLLGRGHQTRAS